MRGGGRPDVEGLVEDLLVKWFVMVVFLGVGISVCVCIFWGVGSLVLACDVFWGGGGCGWEGGGWLSWRQGARSISFWGCDCN